MTPGPLGFNWGYKFDPIHRQTAHGDLSKGSRFDSGSSQEGVFTLNKETYCRIWLGLNAFGCMSLGEYMVS
jgi:hypothetical protein